MRLGSLFSGYGGLDLAVEAVTGARPAWCCEFDAAPSRILAHHWPDVPNLGDITTVDWGTVEPVDILTGGFPCQDLSHAGKRAGLRPGTRSGLWEHMAYAIDQLRPRLVVAENVRGLLSATADSDLEPCPWCVGGSADGEPVLRALGAVLGDLADLGYDAEWYGLRAADVGAPHGRFRVFVVAYPQGHPWRFSDGDGGAAADPDCQGLQECWRSSQDGTADGGQRAAADRGGSQRLAPVTLLPTPAVNDMGEGKTVEQWDAWTERMRESHGNGNGHGPSLSIEAQRLLGTPTANPDKYRSKDHARANRTPGEVVPRGSRLRTIRASHRPVGGRARPAGARPDRGAPAHRAATAVPGVRRVHDGPSRRPRHLPRHRAVLRGTAQGAGKRRGTPAGRGSPARDVGRCVVTVCAICGHVGELVRNEALGISWCVDAWPCLMRADGLRRDPVGVGGQLRIEGVR